MSAPLLLYGATGYTGKLIVQRLLALGVQPVVGGRDAAKLAAVAEPVGLAQRVAHLSDADALQRALRDVAVVLNAAGPFSHTAQPMVAACRRAGVHYLDVTGEVRVIDALAQQHAAARASKIMVMPAVGFDVVPSDCLAAHVAQRLPGADQLRIALTGLGLMTRASLKTLVEAWGGGLVRRDGELTAIPLGSLRRDFDYGTGPRASLSVSWGDLATAYYTTGIGNVETYCASTPMLESVARMSRYLGWALASEPWQLWLKTAADMIPEGPSERERAGMRLAIVAEATRGAQRVVARMHTPEAYTFTAMTAAAIAKRVLGGDVEIGFQTPARVYGADFVLSFADVVREDIE
jgi:short subunit dehydrogenase-like uncharacterized protein